MKKETSLPFVVVSVAIVIMGLALAVVQGLMRAPALIQTALIKVEKPDHPDFTKYDELLHTFVKGDRIDYKALRQSPLLDAAMNELAKTSSANFSKSDEIMAYWLNAHNLLSIKIAADKYPAKSCLLFKRDFVTRQFPVGGEALSVETIWTDKIRQRMVSKNKNETSAGNAIFLMCRAALGYPKINDHAITAQNIFADSATAAQTFLKSPANVQYIAAKDTLAISPFFQMYREVFGIGFEDPWAFVMFNLDQNDEIPETPMMVKTFLPKFDWSVNDIK